MAVLDEEQRKKYATIGKDRYPIPDRGHARAAIGRINQGGLSHEEKMKVLRKAHEVLKSGKKEVTHSHTHTHADGTTHSHEHTHEGDMHEHTHKH